MTLPTWQACLALGALGVLSHLTFFIRADPNDASPTLALLFVTLPALVTLALNTLFHLSYYEAVTTAAAWCLSYIGAVFISILIYRLYFHKLKNFPGPSGARISQFWHVAKIWKKVDQFRHLDRLHQQYGEYVRAGPNLLSISDPDIVNVVHGPATTFDKAEWYQAGKPLTTLHQMSDRVMHDKRRRHGWEKVCTIYDLSWH